MSVYSPAFTGTHCAYPLRDGQAESTWVAGHIWRWLTCPQTVARPSSNRARHRVTLLIPSNTLTTTPPVICNCSNVISIISGVSSLPDPVSGSDKVPYAKELLHQIQSQGSHKLGEKNSEFSRLFRSHKLHQGSFHINTSNITGHHRTADIYSAGSLLPEIPMIITFTQSTAVLHKYLNDELKIHCLL